jgi:hypothetical protein
LGEEALSKKDSHKVRKEIHKGKEVLNLFFLCEFLCELCVNPFDIYLSSFTLRNYFCNFARMKKVIAFLLIGMGFWSCIKKEQPQGPCYIYDNFPADDYAYCLYSNHETLVFKSNTGLYDTAIVSRTMDTMFTSFNNGCSTFYINLYDTIEHFKRSTTDTFVIQTAYNLNSPNLSYDVIFSSSSQSPPYHEGFYDYLIIDSLQNNVLINNINYNNVDIIQLDTTYWASTGINGIWRIYYTKQNGILEFDVFRGLSWVKIN